MCDMRPDYLVTVMIKFICCHVSHQASKKTALSSDPGIGGEISPFIFKCVWSLIEI